MILANELVAQWLSKKRVPAIYRVHDKPDEEKLERLVKVAEKLNVSVDLDKMMEPLGVAKWLHGISEHPKRAVLESLLLRSLKQAVYDIVNIGHFGLASNAYLHFTSPIRRYPDIEVHRAVKEQLRGRKADTSTSAIEALRAGATGASKCERAAMEVEREVVNLYRTFLMRDRIDEVVEGTVSGPSGSGLYVTLDEPFVDVLVRFESMGPDRYEATDDELGVEGLRSGDHVMLGDRVVVAIEDAAILRRTVYARRVPPQAVIDAVEGAGRKGKGRGRGVGRGRAGGRPASPGRRRQVKRGRSPR
jgi:ribonuclease R